MLKSSKSTICAPALLLTVLCAGANVLFAQAGPQHLDSGEQIYRAACVACHGSDGKGTPKAIAGFELPDTFPDFSRCDQTTAELDNDYRAVIVHGVRYRGFSQIMPSFSEALTTEQISKVIGYLRHFCREIGLAPRRTESSTRHGD
jgi:mono/diheme cytochrome c family protein